MSLTGVCPTVVYVDAKEYDKLLLNSRLRAV